MEEITIRGTRAQRNLMEWSQRVADCRSSGLSVARWCSEHNVKPKTYYNWQKMVQQEFELDPCRYLTWVLKEAPKRSASDPNWAQTLTPQNAPTDCR